MMDKGIVLVNSPWEPISREDLDGVINLRPDIVQALIYHQQPEQIRVQQFAALRWLAEGCGIKLQYRLSAGKMYDFEPEECAEWASAQLKDMSPGLVIPANEPNHPGEGWPPDPELWVAWAAAFADTFRGLGSPHRLITPALSPNYPDYHAHLELMAGLVRSGKYDYLGLHCYEGSWNALGLVVVPAYITEFNGCNPLDGLFTATRYPVIRGAMWFAWHWPEPTEPGYCSDLKGNAGLSHEFREWALPPGIMEGVVNVDR